MTEQHRIILRALFYAMGLSDYFYWMDANNGVPPAELAMLAVMELAWLERESV